MTNIPSLIFIHLLASIPLTMMLTLTGCLPSIAPVGEASFSQRKVEASRKFIAFGDSIAAGFRLPSQADRWSSLVAKRLDTVEDNQGVGATILSNQGNQPRNGRNRFDTDIKSGSENYVAIFYGLNDLRFGISVQEYRHDLSEIVAGILAKGIKRDRIVLASPPYISPKFYNSPQYAPYNHGSIRIHEAFVYAVGDVAQKYGVRFADVYTAMRNNGSDLLVMPDGIHPNKKGHQVIAQVILTAISRRS